ncbi:MAG: hypothetical protein JSU03_02705 [Bacteroidetes bacterium]|nr:hypothetical protein [Bacteroidota bacterium]
MKLKCVYLLLLCSIIATSTFAQDEKEEGNEKFFKKENLFTGGTLNASFFNGTTALGVSPYFGYSLNKYIDVAVTANINYVSQRQYDYYGNYQGKARQTIYGPGAFVRLFPVKFLFAQAAFEHNFIRYKNIYPSNSGIPNETYNFNANSLLVGAGYASGRGEGNNTYYYISISWDVLKDANSPYLDNTKSALPQIRAGYNIALFQGRHNRY